MIDSKATMGSSVWTTMGLLALLALSTAARAGGGVNTGYFGSVAIKGYDPVAYFTEGRAIKGNGAHQARWLGASWHFSSEQNREAFEATPLQYAPQYGGHCATGLAISGTLTKDIDPEAWAIIDGKLYLNYSKATNMLLKGRVVRTERADANWRKLETASN